MSKLELELDSSRIYIEIQDGILKFEVDGGDGLSLLDQKQIIEVYLFLKKYYADLCSDNVSS